MRTMVPALLSTLLFAITGCKSFHPGAGAASDTGTVIVVEYRYERSTEQIVRQILRSKKVSDWAVRKDGTEETIEARYRELPAYAATEIDARLREIPWVLSVEIKRDSVPPGSE
jgi:preprotein translocase subunit SecF